MVCRRSKRAEAATVWSELFHGRFASTGNPRTTRRGLAVAFPRGMATKRSVLGIIVTLGLGACGGSQEEEESGIEMGVSDLIEESGPPVLEGSSSEVWRVTRAWADVAPEAGLAWSTNSGLDWEQKFDVWVNQLNRIAKHNGSGQTFEITSPEGKTLPAPALECADVAIFLRAVFALWHELPFYMVASNGSERIYGGHFGFVGLDGQPSSSVGANYKTKYADYTGSAWKSDASLRAKHAFNQGGNIDDYVEFIEPGAGFGAYVDELLLNKRAGHFLVTLLDVLGSMHLGNGNNMFHIEAQATTAGDVLVKRYGTPNDAPIGHTVPVMRRDNPEVPFQLDFVEGWMPRRQPTWGNTVGSRGTFMAEASGGPGYEKFGGGIKRWRTIVKQNGKWRSIVGTPDVYIGDQEYERIAARPARFGELLGQASPEATRDALVAKIEGMRSALSQSPASCRRRGDREEAFAQLYPLMADSFNMSRAEVDTKYRALSDYVFPEIDYNQSKMCCFNDSNAALGETILAFAEEEQRDQCVTPTPYSFEDLGNGQTGYDRIRSWALANGKPWVEYYAHPSEATCSADGPLGDVETDRSSAVTSFCSLENDQ